MTLPVVWSDDATADFLDILDYIAARNVSAVDRLETLIRHTADRLPDHPFIHRPGRVPGTREAIVHPNYILVYRVGTTIGILAVLHAGLIWRGAGMRELIPHPHVRRGLMPRWPLAPARNARRWI